MPLIARELVLPSPPDIGVMARLGIEGHRVITPFVVHDGHVMKPKPGDRAPHLEWVIERPREAGRTADGETVYEATLVGEVGGKPVVQIDVWSTEPLNATPDKPGHLYMSPPEMTPTTSRPAPGSKKTPVGGPTPTDPTARLTSGPDGITAGNLAALASKHGKDAVVWAGESLDGAPAKRLFDALEPAALAGMRDLPAAEALRNLDVFGKANIEKAVPPLTGRQLQVEREQLGGRASRGIFDEKLKVNKVAALNEHANNLAASTTTSPASLGSDSLVVDSNVLAGIKELMGGVPWAKLDAHKKNGINWLRRHGDPPLPGLTADPPARDVASIIGEGHDLRAANNTLGENAPMAGLDRSGFEVTIGRDSTQYNLVLDELASAPEPIGESKGDGDRAIVADTMFAASPGVPRLMTGDNAMIKRLFKRYCPDAAKLPKLKQRQSMAEAIAAKHPGGYEAVIPDGLGGTRTILVIAMVK